MADNKTTPEPEITVTPDDRLHLVDDELHIRVVGLPGLQDVTLHMVIREGTGSIESRCCYKADNDGVVDLTRHPCLSGSYKGVSPMGIFWSMTPSPGMRRGYRLMKRDVNTPVVAELTVYSGHLTDGDVTPGDRDLTTTSQEPVMRRTIERWYKGSGVTCRDVTDGRVRGRLYVPSGAGPFPGVLDVYGTAGGLLEYRASLLASRGIAALALPYFRYQDLPQDVQDIDLDYFVEAASWLVSCDVIKGPKIGVIGNSRGAEIGYMLASQCPEVCALVCISGCTCNPGKPFKYSRGDIPGTPIMYDKVKVVDDCMVARDMFTYTADALIPVWRHDPIILNIVGEDDAFTPTSDSVNIMKKHYPRDKVHRFQIRSYPGAGHLIEPPYMPLCDMSYHKTFGTYFKWGGEPKPHADAQDDFWRSTLAFLHENLPQGGDPSKL